MNQCFCDTNQKVVIKVLNSSQKVNCEIAGSEIFSRFACTPKIEQLDKRTVKISVVSGTNASLVDEKTLNEIVIKLFCAVKEFEGKILEEFSIRNTLENFEIMFSDRPGVVKVLEAIKENVKSSFLLPVHGDLQKQNIFLEKGKLILIDFEHFIFAPLELELANSLFFNDSNCLDAESIIPILVKRKVISIKLLAEMLTFYSIKELAQGRPEVEVIGNLKKGIARLRVIAGEEVNVDIPDFSEKFDYWTTSSCFV